ncbi:hypothetical protein FRC06_004175 [Ceratobasidium sp. 370]|nr:hypothetical protein FRC06_004175 [Ceratobasidium sp. 370]
MGNTLDREANPTQAELTEWVAEYLDLRYARNPLYKGPTTEVVEEVGGEDAPRPARGGSHVLIPDAPHLSFVRSQNHYNDYSIKDATSQR